MSSTAEIQRRTQASIRARFHQLEDAAVCEVRRTVLEAAPEQATQKRED